MSEPETNPPQTEESAERAQYAFDEETFELALPFGSATVLHRLRRPQRAIRQGNKIVDEWAERERLIVFETAEVEKEEEYKIDTSAADQWFWNRLCTHIKGYPGHGADWIEVSDEIRQRMRGAHKERIVAAFLAARAEVLTEKTEVTFEGGAVVYGERAGPAATSRR